MKLCVHIQTDITLEQAKVLHKTDDSVCARQVAHEAERAIIKKLRLRLGTDPANDAATLASALWGRKRQATTLYLFVSHRDLEVLHDQVYLAALQKAFGHCTRRSPSTTFALVLVPRTSLAQAI